ncbi:MAG: hypothetical protein WC343_11730 [Bacilli bacterium]|jgi:hypothetical protein
MPDFSWKWWWEKVFVLLDQIETRDVLIFLGALGMFILIWTEKIHSEHLGSIVAAIAGYAVGRPNTRRGGE